MHCHVLLLKVDKQPGGEAVTHDLPVVAHTVGVVPQLYLGPQRAEHDGLHVSDGEPVAPQVTEILRGKDRDRPPYSNALPGSRGAPSLLGQRD